MRICNGELIFIVLLLFSSCKIESNDETKFGDIGDIRFDPKTDDPNFMVCHEDLSLQFNYNGVGFVYEGEKPALKKHFQKTYSSEKIIGQSGYITIRFVINCDGIAGRFRVLEMGLDLTEKKFKKRIVDDILKATKQANGWVGYVYEGKKYDYYQYLVFKLDDAQIIDILP